MILQIQTPGSRDVIVFEKIPQRPPARGIIHSGSGFIAGGNRRSRKKVVAGEAS